VLLEIIATGVTTNEVAHSLVLSERMVERYIANPNAKIGVGNRAGATACAVRWGLV
jgi:DNA-binding NarL/FixJ family response regulator